MEGFTLLELVIVVLIVGILAAGAIPLMNASVREARLQAAATEILTAVEHARFRAAMTGRPCRVTIDAGTDKVLVEQQTFAALEAIRDPGVAETGQATIDPDAARVYAPVDHPLVPGRAFELEFGTLDGTWAVEIGTSPFGTATPLVFDALGMPSAGGNVVLRFGGRTRAVTVDAASGRAAIGN